MKKAKSNPPSASKSAAKKGGKSLPVVLTFFLSFVCFGILFYNNIKFNVEISQERIQYITNSQVNKLNSAMANYLYNLRIWEVLVRENNGEVENFDKIAATLYDGDPAVRSIQLAPNGVVTQVYPLKGNEDAFGDLFADPDRRTEAEYARDTGEMTLAGPFELYQGGAGLVARQPIYLESGGGPTFWGFAIVVLNVPEIFEMAELSQLYSAGYEYKLWRIHPDTAQVQVILESSDKVLQNPATMSFTVPNSTWNFDVAPIGGWVDYRVCGSYFFASVLLSLLLSAVVWLILNLKTQRTRLAVLSYTDSLTNLFNLRKLMERIKEYERSSGSFGIVFLDLDGFKKVNDTYGHDVGDQLLIVVARRLDGVRLREEKTAFRIGGDEFILLLDGDYDEDYYRRLIDRLEAVLSQDIRLGELTLRITASAGFARFPRDGAGAENIIKLADEKMYAKKAGLYQ